MKRCVIIGGADIENDAAVKRQLQGDETVVYCDSGLKHRERLALAPDLIVGDFDSHENPQLAVETIVLPCEKDDTDTVYAVKEMVRRGYEEFLLAGVVGARLDHTLGNVSILLYLDTLGKRAVIVDDYAEMEVVSQCAGYVENSYSYFSLLNISGTARDVTIEGAKYPLSQAEISCDYQYGISNEVLPEQTAKITVGEGRLLLIKIR